MSDEVMLDLTSVHVAYSGVLAIEDASLTVPAGGSVCLLGPNGAGKTTILRAISGLLGFHGGRVLGGHVRYRGEDVTNRSADRLVRSGICQVLERRHVFADLTVAENLRAGAFALRDRRLISQSLDMVLGLLLFQGNRLRQQGGIITVREQQK